MKTLSKSAIVLALTALGVYLLAVFFSNHIFSIYQSSISKAHINAVKPYKAPFFVALVVLIIFIGNALYVKKVQRLHDHYYNFFDGNPMPLAIVDFETGKFLATNKAAVATYGYSREEFLKLTLADIRVNDEPEHEWQGSKTDTPQLTKGQVKHHRKKNGEVILAEVSASEVIFKKKRCKLLLAHDITEIVKARQEKRIAEEEKARQENFTSYVLENFPVDVAVFDKDHRYIFLNKTAVGNDEMRSWMIGKDDFDYFSRKGAGLAIAEKRRELFLKAISGESKEWIDEHIVDGKLKYLLRKFYPYYENGKLKCVYGYGMDITEVKKAQIQKDEYIEQLERIAFTTSHKLRQPICNLQGLISLVELEELDRHELQNIISCMKNSISTLDEFTRQLGVRLDEYKQTLSTPDDYTTSGI